jgi:hypothetical protein
VGFPNGGSYENQDENQDETQNEKQTAAKPIFVSKQLANGRKAFHPKQASSAHSVDYESSTAIKNYSKNWAATISAHATPTVDFKNCCMLTGEYDGSERDDYFRD